MMTKGDFLEELRLNGIDSAGVSFDDNIKEGYGIRKVYFRWEIFFRERGDEFNVRGYPSESDALQALLVDILAHK